LTCLRRNMSRPSHSAPAIRRWMLASDERRVFRRVARARIGDARILTTPGILVLAVGGGVISVEELRGAREELERNRFTVLSAAYGGLRWTQCGATVLPAQRMPEGCSTMPGAPFHPRGESPSGAVARCGVEVVSDTVAPLVALT